MKQEVIKIKVKGSSYLDLDKFEPFQDEIKSLDKVNYEKMRLSILKQGFSFAVHVWKNKNKNFIIDGHQRVFTLKQLRDNEGYKIPPIPIAIVEANSLKEAKQKVLSGASVYGELSEDNLFGYIQRNGIDFETMVAQFDLPEIDLSEFAKRFEDLQPNPTLPKGEIVAGGQMPSSSVEVKQLQLYFNAPDYQELMNKTTDLSGIMKTENISDTILGVVRAYHSSQKSKLK